MQPELFTLGKYPRISLSHTNARWAKPPLCPRSRIYPSPSCIPSTNTPLFSLVTFVGVGIRLHHPFLPRPHQSPVSPGRSSPGTGSSSTFPSPSPPGSVFGRGHSLQNECKSYLLFLIVFSRSLTLLPSLKDDRGAGLIPQQALPMYSFLHTPPRSFSAVSSILRPRCSGTPLYTRLSLSQRIFS